MTRRLLEEPYVALTRYESRLAGPSDELEAVGDLKMRLEPALGAGAGEVVCPACSRVYHQHPADAEANSLAGCCGDCLAESDSGGGPTNALLAQRPPWMLGPSPVVLSLCHACRRNATAGEPGEASVPACSGCRTPIHTGEEGGTA